MSKLSFSTMGTPGLGAFESIRMARSFGYSGVDLRVSDPQYHGEISPDATSAEISLIQSVFASEGIQPSGLFCYCDDGGKDARSWVRMEESMTRHLEIARRLGSPSIRIFGGNPGIYAVRDDFIKKTAEVIAGLLQREGQETSILVQNHTGNFTAKEVMKLIKLAASPGLRMAYSPDHSVMEGENIDSLLPELKFAAGQLYAADVFHTGERFMPVLPGKGTVPLREVFQALGGASYEGWVTFKWEKIWNKSLDEPQIALPYFIRFYNNLCRLITV